MHDELVPDAAPDAEVDPYFAELTRGGHATLPGWYMPATMATRVTGWRKTAAWTVIVLLVSAASGGICLTYGPEELWRILG